MPMTLCPAVFSLFHQIYSFDKFFYDLDSSEYVIQVLLWHDLISMQNMMSKRKSCCDIFLYKTLHFKVNLFSKFAFDTKLFKFLYDLDLWPQYQNYIFTMNLCLCKSLGFDIDIPCHWVCQYLRHVVYIYNLCTTLTFDLYVGSGGYP